MALEHFSVYYKSMDPLLQIVVTKAPKIGSEETTVWKHNLTRDLCVYLQNRDENIQLNWSTTILPQKTYANLLILYITKTKKPIPFEGQNRLKWFTNI